MSRNRKSNFEFFIELAAMLPPWASATLAVLSYLGLHYLSLQQVAPVTGIKDAAPMVISSFIHVGADIGQYFLPLIFCIGAVISVFKRRKRETLVTQTKARGKLSALFDMSWQDFELLVSETYRQQGYQVTEAGGAGPDGGIDLVLTKGSENFLVQCKQWKAQSSQG